MSGKDQLTEIVEGFAVGGLFVHHPLTEMDRPKAYHDQWVITHSQSGMSLGCWFDKRSDAVDCAQEITEVYDVTVGPKELIAQFRTRFESGKLSVEEIAKKHGMKI